jgi:mRNA interferase RelE/StbE
VSRRIGWSKRAAKEFDRLDRHLQHRIAAALDRLASHEGGDLRKLEGVDEETWRLRVGDWRILFRYGEDSSLLILRVRPRGSAYEP